MSRCQAPSPGPLGGRLTGLGGSAARAIRRVALSGVRPWRLGWRGGLAGGAGAVLYVEVGRHEPKPQKFWGSNGLAIVSESSASQAAGAVCADSAGGLGPEQRTEGDAEGEPAECDDAAPLPGWRAVDLEQRAVFDNRCMRFTDTLQFAKFL